MSVPERPHLLGIDDGPFDKWGDRAARRPVPIVGVMMEGADLVEAVATTRLDVDADDATGFLAEWIRTLRCRAQLHGILLGGVTIAGLAIVDPSALAAQLELPVLIVNRKPPQNERLRAAFAAAGFATRSDVLERLPSAVPVQAGLHVAAAGIESHDAVLLVRRSLRKSVLPEPLRLAHLIAAAVATGESRGRP